MLKIQENSYHKRKRDLILDAANLAERMGLSGAVKLEQLAGGRNNRVFKMMVNGQRFILKSYFVHSDDKRERLGNEFSFLRFAWEKGLRCIPRPLISDKENHIALYQFIEGARLKEVDITDDAIGQAIGFVAELNKYRRTDEAKNLPIASEACFSIEDHMNCVERRLNRLREIETFDSIRKCTYDFIKWKLTPCWLEIKNNILKQFGKPDNAIDEPINNREFCISPSDFGFHNALVKKNGNLSFIDFEYAGWDDPAKLICDFICQPELPISKNHALKVMSGVAMGFDERNAIIKRTENLHMMHRLKWCCILLNEFISADWQRRFHAGIDNANLLRQQLDKAKQYFIKHITCVA